MIRFPDFELQIDPKILYRGKDYYNSEAITDLNETEPGEWLAYVEGTELYTVELSISKNQVESWFCNCPYDGAVCKHVVATLFAIRDQQKAIAIFTSAKDRSKTKEAVSAGQTDSQPSQTKLLLRDALKQADKKEIIEFICQYAIEHPVFAEDAQKHFIPIQNTDHLSTTYDQDVANSYTFHTSRRSRHRYGDYDSDIDYEATARNLSKHLEKATFLFESGALGDAAAIAIQILEVVARNYDQSEYNYYEDDGYLNCECEKACEFLLEIIDNSNTSDILKAEICAAIDQIKDEEAFEDGAVFPIDDFVHELNIQSRSKEEALEYLTQIIDSQTENNEKTQFVREKINILRELEREEEANHIVLQFLHLPEIRQDEIERLMRLEKYQEALILTDEAIERVQKSKEYYLVTRWKELKLQLLTTLNRTSELIETGRELFIQQNGDMKVYHLLKKHIEPDLWKAFLLKMIEQTKFDFRQVEADIYAEEKEYEKLLVWVKKNSSSGVDSVNRYLPHLKAHYPNELLDIYSNYVLNYAEKNIGRGHYQHIAQTLKKMKTIMGGDKLVGVIVAEFRTTYKNRRAMMEELSMY